MKENPSQVLLEKNIKVCRCVCVCVRCMHGGHLTCSRLIAMPPDILVIALDPLFRTLTCACQVTHAVQYPKRRTVISHRRKVFQQGLSAIDLTHQLGPAWLLHAERPFRPTPRLHAKVAHHGPQRLQRNKHPIERVRKLA